MKLSLSMASFALAAIALFSVPSDALAQGFAAGAERQPADAALASDGVAADADLFDDEELDEAGVDAKAAATASADPFRATTFNNFIGSAEYGFVDDPFADGHSERVMIVSPVFKPFEDAGGVYNPHYVGARYRADLGKWTVVNQDHADMPLDTYCNVRVGSGAIHKATLANSQGDHTVIDDERLNGKPDASLHASVVYDPSGVSGVYVDHPIAVRYNGAKWEIVHTDGSPVLDGECYSLSFDESFVHTATAANTNGSVTVIDVPEINGRRSAYLLVTPVVGASSKANPHPIAANYDGAHWTILNQDLTPIPAGASFNVAVIEEPTINALFFKKDRFIITGWTIKPGIAVVVDGVERPAKVKTPSVGTGSGRLVLRGLAEYIAVGDTVTVQLRNPDGCLSELKHYTRQP